MKILRMMIPFLLLAGCGEKVDYVSETYYEIAGVYHLESMKFKEPRAVDLNGDGISSEDIMSELNMFMDFVNNQRQMRATVKGGDSGPGDDMAEINGSGTVSLQMLLQTYDKWSHDKVATRWMYFDMDFTINSNGFLSVRPYEEDSVRGEISFPMENVMIFTINYGFYDVNTHSICNMDSEWRFVRVTDHLTE